MSDLSTSVPRFNVLTADFEAIPGAEGRQRILYESPDGRRRAGSFKEPGHHELVMPVDEVMYVVAGRTTVTVEGGEVVDLVAGDCVYLRKGQALRFDNSEDFHDLSVFMAHDDAPG